MSDQSEEFAHLLVGIYEAMQEPACNWSVVGESLEGKEKRNKIKEGAVLEPESLQNQPQCGVAVRAKSAVPFD